LRSREKEGQKDEKGKEGQKGIKFPFAPLLLFAPFFPFFLRKIIFWHGPCFYISNGQKEKLLLKLTNTLEKAIYWLIENTIIFYTRNTLHYEIINQPNLCRPA
jgi:hypothetical protein